jgi:hypothetical protein
MLGNGHLRRLARQWARLHRGGAGRRAMADCQLAATELALACDKQRRGLIPPAVFARRRQDMLGLMRAAVTVFHERRPLMPHPPGRPTEAASSSRLRQNTPADTTTAPASTAPPASSPVARLVPFAGRTALVPAPLLAGPIPPPPPVNRGCDRPVSWPASTNMSGPVPRRAVASQKMRQMKTMTGPSCQDAPKPRARR